MHSTREYTSHDKVTPGDAENMLYRAYYTACYGAAMEGEYGEPVRALNYRQSAERIEQALVALSPVETLRGVGEQCVYLASKATRDAVGD
jgi:hypothetical protein